MIDRENAVFDEIESFPQPEVNPSKNIFLILIILAILASISGFLILFSIIAVSISSTAIVYPYGFILGILLSLGGLILLLGLIIIHQESKKTEGFVLSDTNEK